VGVVAAAALARRGLLEEGRALRDRALDDPAAAPIRPQSPAFEAYYLDLPAGRLDDALAHVGQGIAALEQGDPFGRLPYVLLFNFAIHEERGEDQEALALAARGRELARRAGLAGWVGAGTTIRMASLRARLGDAAGAEADLAEVGPGWRAWGVWEIETTRAAIAAGRGDAREARAAAERAASEAGDRWPWFDRMRCAAILAPVLVRAGQPGRAREIMEATLADRPSGFSGARLGAVLAWLLHEEGDETGSVAALAAVWEEAGDQARHVMRREWPRLERPLWVALEHGAIDAGAAIGALAGALPGAAALAPFTRHPSPAVRRAALLAAVAAGHPDGVERLHELSGDPDPEVAGAARAAAEQLRREPPALAFRLLGGFELRRGSWVVDESAWERRVAQRMVQLLLCRGGGPVTEDELIEAFWPDKPAAAGRRSLQVAVSAARSVLDPPGSDDSRLVGGERSYRLDLREADTVDAEEFERAAAAALAAPAESRTAGLAAAAARWTGEPLPEERYEDWAIPWRERLIDRHAEVLAALSDAHVEAGDLPAAVDVARRLVQLDPLDESAHRRLIAAYARAGRRGHALRQFLACRRSLVAELGVEPGAETAALQRRVLAGEPV
jgi:DNA-binding SARP family transcriptional activator